MNLTFGFVIFIGAMIWCITSGYTMVIALFVGLIAFAAAAFRQGFSAGDLVKMGAEGLRDAVIVIEVMFIIGFITAVWRSSGTITYFIYYGIKVITPGLFLLITFALCCLLSYALGTSFGVCSTAGVIFMALARTGGVNELLTAGVVMSGIYFGDRGSPVSSSAILVASVTGTDLLKNVKMMVKTGLVPLLITLGIYTFLSFSNPIQQVDKSFLHTLSSEFAVSPWCLIPALCMVVLPLMKVKVVYAMLASIASGAAVSVFVQGMEFSSLINCLIFGYTSEGELGRILGGGGMLSMIEIVCIVALSSTYSGIFSGTSMLSGLQSVLMPLMKKIGRFGTMTVTSFVFLAVFCNQTIASMMCCDMMKRPYEDSGAGREELAADMENSVIVLAGLVPWAIACSVPLGFLQADLTALVFAVYLYAVPLCYAVQKKVTNPFGKE